VIVQGDLLAPSSKLDDLDATESIISGRITAAYRKLICRVMQNLTAVSRHHDAVSFRIKDEVGPTQPRWRVR
jgi:hypothetical protein